MISVKIFNGLTIKNRNAMDYAVSFNHEDIIHYLNKNKKT